MKNVNQLEIAKDFERWYKQKMKRSDSLLDLGHYSPKAEEDPRKSMIEEMKRMEPFEGEESDEMDELEIPDEQIKEEDQPRQF